MINQDDTTTVRISKNAHDILRYNAYKQNRKMIDIVDDLADKLEKPSVSDKVGRALGKK